jgi:hypothetical protein
MNLEERFARRQSNSRYELLLQIAGAVGLVFAALSFLRFGLIAAMGFTLGSLVALAVGRLFVALNALADQLEELRARSQKFDNTNGGVDSPR